VEGLNNCIVLLNVYNSEEYLEQVLKSIYSFPRLIVIIDGAYSKKMPSHHSTDGTQKIVETFPDPDKKIVYKRTWSTSQRQQRSKGLKYLKEGDWLMICDDDEIYKGEDLIRLKEFLETVAKKDNYWIGSYTFINSFDWYRWITSPRLFRYKPRMAFTGSNSLTWDNGKKKYHGRLTIPNVTRYHYSYVRNNKRVEIRQIQTAVSKYPYVKCGRFFTRKDIHPVGFTGTHPEIMQSHPYAKITWHPKLSRMIEGPHAKAKLPTEIKKKEPEKKKSISKWEEFYKPFHKKDYEQHIEAWKGFCHRVAKFAPKKGKILEMGSGTGMMSIYLSKMGFYAIGLDNNSEMVRRAKNLVLEVGGKARFACHDLFNLDLKVVGTYRVVFSQGLLEHFTDVQIRKALEIQFKIAPIVIFSVPLDKFGHQSKGDERLLSDSFWRRMIARYELLHFSKFAGESQIIVAIKRR